MTEIPARHLGHPVCDALMAAYSAHCDEGYCTCNVCIGEALTPVVLRLMEEPRDLYVDRLRRALERAEAAVVEARKAALHDARGVGLIAAERERQVAAEGWTPEHDDEHADGELARAAACYAMPADFLKCVRRPLPWNTGDRGDSWFWLPEAWPWRAEDWKPQGGPFDPLPSGVLRLVKAGALIAAEIDRLLRAREANL